MYTVRGEEERKKHSPFGSVQGALRWSPQEGVKVGVREGVRVGVEEGVRRGVEEGVRRGVEEGVRIPRLGVSGDVPALGQQAEGDEEEEGEATHGTGRLHL